MFEVRDLIIRAGQDRLIEKLSFDLPNTALTCLIGPSGCGKSLAVKWLSGVLAPELDATGVARLGNAPITLPHRDIAYQPQQDTLFPWLTITENAGLGLEIRGTRPREARNRVRALFETFGQQGHDATRGRRLVYNADNDEISRPRDLEGKTYAGFGSAWEDALISTMIENDGGKPDYDTVTLGTDAYEALASGAMDFTLEVATWEGVNSELLGRDQSHFLYNDYGVPEPQGGYIGTRSETLAGKPETVDAFMEATRKGYEWAAAHPAEAAEILIGAGDFPNEDLVRGSMRVIDEGGYLTDGTTTVGLIDHVRLETMAKFLYGSGVLRGADGEALEWSGEVSSGFDQSWRAK